MLDIIVVRHGESVRNHAALLAHKGDPQPLADQLAEDSYEPGWALTQHGWEQAKAAGDWIEQSLDAPPTHGFVSPYFRTLQTARGLGLEIAFEQDWRLRERHWGEYGQLKDKYTVDQYLSDLTRCGEPYWRADLPGAESVMDLLPNVRSFVQDRLYGLVEASVVIVTHGGTMRALQALLTGQADIKPQSTPNCSLLHLCLEEIHPDGSAIGELKQEFPWVPETPHLEWQHFG